MEDEYNQWRPHFQELAEFILPRRYVWLAERSPVSSFGGNASHKGSRASRSRSERILDPTATKALRTLAAGMLNGVTSPTRPWFRLRPAGFPDDAEMPQAHKAYFEERTRRMHLIMAESNLYNALAVLYLDLCCFGTAAMLVYEDFDSVFRCYNSPVGEFRVGQDFRRQVSTFNRSFYYTLAQMRQRFDERNLRPELRAKARLGGSNLQQPYTICHLIEENDQGRPESLPPRFKYREFYWDAADSTGQMLDMAGYTEVPGAFPRWELTGNDPYGTSPAMDALPDVIQLQHETIRKAQGIDKMMDPAVIVEGFMAQNLSLLPGSINVAPSSASFGARQIQTVNPPIGEMTRDIQAIQMRIAEIFHNDLFRMISSLETVRSATEIDARREEKLVLLGPVLERFENEALDPIIKRVSGIMERKGLNPEVPPGLEEMPVEVQYVSVLSDAQRAVGTATAERFMQIVGNMAGIAPEVLADVNFSAGMRDYGNRLNVGAKWFRSEDEAEAIRQKNTEQQDAQQEALVGREVTEAAKNLSATDVGGGRSAIQQLIGS